MESRPVSLVSAKKLLADSGFEEKTAERIIATTGLHEERIRDIAEFKAAGRQKEKLSKYLAIYSPVVVSRALKSDVNLDNVRRMNELAKAHGKPYFLNHHEIPFTKLDADPCPVWNDRLKSALAAAEKDKSRAPPFSGRLEIKGSRGVIAPTEDWYRQGGFSLVLYPSEADKARLEKDGARLDLNYQHEPGALGFARFYVCNGRLIVSNLQSDLYRPQWHDSPDARNAIRKRYARWGNYLLSSLEGVARKAGLKEVVVCTADDVFTKYASIDPHKTFKIYSEVPQQEGYSLFQTPARTGFLGHHRAKNLFWGKKL